MSFSVLMSVYYKEKAEYLRQAIESIVTQKKMPSEVVIVKDGELTHELNKVIEEFDKTYIGLFKIISLEKNMGLGEALEIGVTKCSNELVARMDSDDICLPDRFEIQKKFMENNKEIDIVGSWIKEFYNEPDNVVSIRYVPLKHDEIISYARKRNPLNHMSVMFRKEAVMKAGNYQPFLWYEDYYLWVRMIMENSKIANIDQVLALVRTDNNMFKRRGGIDYIKSEVKFQKQLLKYEFINRKEFLRNIIIRVSVRLIPNIIRKLFYRKFLRKKP
ncbi:glycosyltransferase [Clostridium sp. JNZ J1-5]